MKKLAQLQDSSGRLRPKIFPVLYVCRTEGIPKGGLAEILAFLR